LKCPRKANDMAPNDQPDNPAISVRKPSSRNPRKSREGMIQKKSRTIPEPVRCMLWGRSAGRCEWCNRPVSYHPQTKEMVNLAEAAHIIGFSEAGPRGEKDLSDELARDIDNLMLLCRLCHKAVDTNKAQYPVDRLRRMKRQHEQRVEQVTSIGQERESHILLYGANVGDHNSPVSYRATALALIAAWSTARSVTVRINSGRSRPSTSVR